MTYSQWRATCRLMTFAAAISAALALGGCGGSSGGGDDGGSPAPQPSVDSGLDERPANPDCVAPERPGTGAVGIELTRVYPDLTLSSPVHAMQAPGDASRWFVVEQAGRVRTFQNTPDVSVASTFIDLTDRVNSGGEKGLLGMAFDPAFATNRRVFLSYTRGSSPLQSVIASYTSPDDGLTLDPASEQVLLTVDQPFDNHNGGHLAFGPDGMLYVGLGDGGSSGDPQDNGQDSSTLLGKILRLDVSAGSSYSIPDGNPHAGQPLCSSGSGAGACPEIHALGFRNPWRYSFDRDTGELWVGDVGQGAWEEINRVAAGGNYGWRFREGAHCYNPSSDCPTTQGGAPLIDPVAEYGRDVGASVTGGYVYRGSRNPALAGRYVFGDFVSGRIFTIAPGAASLEPFVAAQTSQSIASFTEDLDGELYVVDYAGGLYRVDEAAGSGSDTIPERLSETGCVDPDDPTQPAAGLVSYEPNAGFWSDGAAKSRWLAVPDGESISVGDDDDWNFPAGSVLVKNFSLDDQLVETRLFMRHPDGVWAGYTYEWNDAQTEATRVVGGKRRTFGTHEWIYPSEAECLQCHTSAAGRTLGLETAQLNGRHTYAQTGRTANQLLTLDAIDLLRPGLPEDVTSLPAHADPADTSAGLDERARAYLHANCAGCHQPGGPTPSELDLRHDTPLADTGACDVAPTSGDLGLVDARIVAPGAPDRSVLVERVGRRDGTAMPPIASTTVDAEGVALLSDWISGLGSCGS